MAMSTRRTRGERAAREIVRAAEDVADKDEHEQRREERDHQVAAEVTAAREERLRRQQSEEEQQRPPRAVRQTRGRDSVAQRTSGVDEDREPAREEQDRARRRRRGNGAEFPHEFTKTIRMRPAFPSAAEHGVT